MLDRACFAALAAFGAAAEKTPRGFAFVGGDVAAAHALLVGSDRLCGNVLAIGVNAFDDEEVALELLHYLIANYPEAITARYKVQNVSEHTDETLLEAIARYRGAIQSGGRVNTTKAAEIVIHDFRSAALGRLTLETPTEFAQWLASGLKADAERAEKKAALQKEKKSLRKTKN